MCNRLCKSKLLLLALLTLHFTTSAPRTYAAEPTEVKADQMSAHDLLSLREFEKFKTGLAKDALLKDLHWRGNLIEAAEFEGKQVFVIEYRLLTDDPAADSGETALAVFVDGKFEKFVKYPPGATPQVNVGEFLLIAHALKAPPLDLVGLKKLFNTTQPSQIDPGLTVAWLLLSPAVMAGQANRKAEIAAQFTKNVKLRDQFNASRLKLGASENEVQKIFAAKPIESVELKGLTCRIYGSEMLLDEPGIHIHYSNVLTLFKAGKLIGFYSIPGGPYNVQLMNVAFKDWPKR